MGLDQFAVPFLRQALIASIRSGKAVATRPFTLAEGGRGYVLYKALEAIPDFDPDSGVDIDSNTVSILIKTDELLRFAGGALPEATARLMYRDTEGGEITESMAATRRPDYLLTFGKRVFQRQLDDFGQPFRLALEADNGLSGRDLAFAVALFCLAGLIGRFYLQNTYQRYLSQLSREQALQALAEERAGLARRVAERTEGLGQKTMEIQRLAGKLARQHEDHCRVIAHELHDEFGQLLTAIGINTRLLANRIGTDAAGLSAETQGLIDRLHGAMRSLIGRLRWTPSASRSRSSIASICSSSGNRALNVASRLTPLSTACPIIMPSRSTAPFRSWSTMPCAMAGHGGSRSASGC